MDDNAIDYVEQYRAQLEWERQQDLMDFGPPEEEQEEKIVNEVHLKEDKVKQDVQERAKAIQEAHDQWMYRNGKYFYKRDPSLLAFKDKGDKLTTTHSDIYVTRAMVKLEASKGKEYLTVKGSKEFKRQAWRAGQELGVEVRGYKPDQAEILSVQRYQANKAVAETVAKDKIKDPDSLNRTLQAIDERQRDLDLEDQYVYDVNSQSRQPTQKAPEHYREYTR